VAELALDDDQRGSLVRHFDRVRVAPAMRRKAPASAAVRRGRVKRPLAAVSATAMLVVGAAGPAAAATQTQDGLVNVAVGDVTIARDVNLAVAADIAANACGVNVGPVIVLAQNVDTTSTAATVYTTGAQAVQSVQN
jgi:hypothetical protein